MQPSATPGEAATIGEAIGLAAGEAVTIVIGDAAGDADGVTPVIGLAAGDGVTLVIGEEAADAAGDDAGAVVGLLVGAAVGGAVWLPAQAVSSSNGAPPVTQLWIAARRDT